MSRLRSPISSRFRISTRLIFSAKEKAGSGNGGSETSKQNQAETPQQNGGESGNNSSSTDSTTESATTTPEATAPTTPGTTVPKTAVEQPTSQQERITIPKPPVLKKLKTKKNKVTVTWNKIRKNKAGKKLLAQIKYIEIQAATDPEFKNIVSTRNVGKKKTKATLMKLQRKTTYYVRVRYVGADGVPNWSKVKRIRTK